MATAKELAQARRNLNPHAEAIAAMHMWSDDYAFKQRGGSMDFWDNLPDWKKQLARDLVKRIRQSETEDGTAPLVKMAAR